MCACSKLCSCLCHSWNYFLYYNLKTCMIWHDSLSTWLSLNKSMFQGVYIVVHANHVNVMWIWAGGKWLHLNFMHSDAVIYITALQFVLYVWAPANYKICVRVILRNLVWRMCSTLHSLLIYICPVCRKTLQVLSECGWHWCYGTRLYDQFA
jgi:hypothetical protein